MVCSSAGPELREPPQRLHELRAGGRRGRRRLLERLRERCEPELRQCAHGSSDEEGECAAGWPFLHRVRLAARPDPALRGFGTPGWDLRRFGEQFARMLPVNAWCESNEPSRDAAVAKPRALSTDARVRDPSCIASRRATPTAQPRSGRTTSL